MLKNKKKHMENKDNQFHEEFIDNTADAAEVQESMAVSEEVESPEKVLKEELDLANEKYLRLYAEFDNFRRRTSKERVDLIQSAGKDVIKSLLPILDDFDRAFKSFEGKENDPAIEGVILIANKFKNALTQQGVKEMEAIGLPFDADLHEAITNIPAPSDDMKGKVIDVVEKGYYLNDKVIRYAKVVVGA
ncbi:nucleotide exchange factor GrpE [Solitalea canadensis]|uniref:Protein GrpE n=1 Tax=Solitalea canadensis (strain ATCC 29591 / DSM 3403 / JCM 21819 / LMG 8368 / NBRC 15130 / NCIMB 12057 / USAM 9D) TaxID=929556 RepID=H8KV26_SOLCM|nr:molecular chaperone GrpE (heat shock protein) [Solitalea canadensis DSM 3403]